MSNKISAKRFHFGGLTRFHLGHTRAGYTNSMNGPRPLPRSVVRRLKRQRRRDAGVKSLMHRYCGARAGVPEMMRGYTDKLDLSGVRQGRLQARGEQLELILEGQLEVGTQLALALTYGPTGVSLRKVTESGGRVTTQETRFDPQGREAEVNLHVLHACEAGHHADLLYMGIQRSGNGGGKQMMAELTEFWNENDVHEVDITAVSVGAYAWLKFGFTPSEKSWQKLGAAVREQAEHLALPEMTEAKIDVLTQERDPKAAWALSDLTETVVKDGRSMKLGQALLVNQSWSGSLDLEDPESEARLQDYLS